MALYQIKPSFTAGELSPALYGRTDLAKYDSGAAKLQNFLVLRYGGISNRAGTRHISKTANNKKAVLLPFRYNTEQNYVVEVTAGTTRVFFGGALVEGVSVANSFKEEELELIKYTQSADMMFLVHPNHKPMTLTRYEHTKWVLEPMTITGGPYDDYNVTGLTMTPSGQVGNIQLTASEDYFTSDMVGNVVKIEQTLGGQYKKDIPVEFKDAAINETVNLDNGTEFTLTTPPENYKMKSISVYHRNKAFNDFLFDEENQKLTITKVPSTAYKYKEIKITRNFLEITEGDLVVDCPPNGTVYVESFGFWDGNFSLEKFIDGKWAVVRTQSGNRSQNYNFTETNNEGELTSYRITSTEFNTDVWENENEKQRGYVTIQSFGGEYAGEVEITSIIDPKTAKGTVIKKLGNLEPSKAFAISAWSDEKGYPSCVTFFEDRLVFAGSKTMPQTFWMSKTGDYFNFGTSSPAQDNDAITGTLNGGQMNGIKAMVAFGELIMMTAGGEYKVHGNGKPVTGTNVISQAQEYRGISDVLPVTVGSRIVYLQQQGDIIRDLAYSYEADKYTGNDVNLLAEHLFEQHKIKRMTYQQTPDSIVWCVRDDGVLLGLTYLKEQEVYAWHQHHTDGEFIDVCSISGLQQDELYAVVKRDGNYYVEMFAHRDESTRPEDQFFVDCGVTIKARSKEITGLDHLEDKTVSILADGNVLPQRVVTGGKITLEYEASIIHVGLPIEAEAQTLPLEFTAQDGSYIGRKKRVAKLTMLFKASRGGEYGFTKLDEIKWRSTERWGAPIELFDGKKQMIVPNATWEMTQMLTIKQKDPLPLTVLSVVPEIEAGG